MPWQLQTQQNGSVLPAFRGAVPPRSQSAGGTFGSVRKPFLFSVCNSGAEPPVLLPDASRALPPTRMPDRSADRRTYRWDHPAVPGPLPRCTGASDILPESPKQPVLLCYRVCLLPPAPRYRSMPAAAAPRMHPLSLSGPACFETGGLSQCSEQLSVSSPAWGPVSAPALPA